MLEKPSDSHFESDGFLCFIPCPVECIFGKKDKTLEMSLGRGTFLSQKSVNAQNEVVINMVFVQNTEKRKDIWLFSADIVQLDQIYSWYCIPNVVFVSK